MSEMTQTVAGATQPQSDDASRITARDLRSVFWRSLRYRAPGTTSASSIWAMPSQCRQP